MRRQGAFIRGLVLGVTLSLLMGLITLYLLDTLGILTISLERVPEVEGVLAWLHRNLGLSVVPFGITLCLYLFNLAQLARRLDEDRPQAEIAQLEHLTDVWTSLFFGIGVIWTAIGMRAALLHALGDQEILASAGAFGVLERLVDGGILTALSTTILGGAGGYLMRLGRTFYIGVRLNRYYGQRDELQAGRVEQLLEDIHVSMGRLSNQLPLAPGTGGERG